MTARMTKHKTGAVRESHDDKPALELISPFAELRLGAWLAKGAKRYARRNWERGLPLESTLASLKRHVAKFQAGYEDEDHLAAIMCNAMFLLHTQEMIKRGVLPKELAVMPDYKSPYKKG